jgi:NADH dehydrogenase
MNRKKIIIVGGGFAGVQLTRNLDGDLFDILLIDKVNHHQFQPLFYQVATSQLEPSSISFPLRHIFRRKKHIQIRLGELLKVDPDKKIAKFNIGEFEYDYLVLATGGTTNFFGNENIKKHAFTLKTTYDAITIRNHLLQNFENVLTSTGENKSALLNLVVVGAGPTGVEMAGALAEIKKNVLPKDFHRIDFSDLRIIMIEGSKSTLNSMSSTAQTASEKYLTDLGIELIKETFVKNYDGEDLYLSDGSIIKTKTVVWAAGITANKIDGIPDIRIKHNNRIEVDRYNKLISKEGIYILGDLAYMETPSYPHGHPQVANVAINQAKLLAKNLKNIENGKPLKEYKYKDLGSMATLARNKAVVDLPFMSFKGFSAWIVWMFLHLMLILSVRNKLIIFINWAWAYVSKDTALRLILKENKP